jgi:hypothetical protein
MKIASRFGYSRIQAFRDSGRQVFGGFVIGDRTVNLNLNA